MPRSHSGEAGTLQRAKGFGYPRIPSDLVKTERVSGCGGRDQLLSDGLGRWETLSLPSFMPPFTVCDGWTELEAPDRRGTRLRLGAAATGRRRSLMVRRLTQRHRTHWRSGSCSRRLPRSGWWIRSGQREPTPPVEACTTSATATSTAGCRSLKQAARASRPAAGCVCWLPPSRCARNGLAWSVRAANAGLVRIHGTHRGVLLVEFLDVPWG